MTDEKTRSSDRTFSRRALLTGLVSVSVGAAGCVENLNFMDSGSETTNSSSNKNTSSMSDGSDSNDDSGVSGSVKLVWETDVGESSFTYERGHLFTNDLKKIDSSTGKILWSYPGYANGFSSSPEALYFVNPFTDNTEVTAYSTEDGSDIWVRELDASGGVSGVHHRGTSIYMAFSDGNVISIGDSNGDYRWSYGVESERQDDDDPVIISSLIGDDSLYLETKQGVTKLNLDGELEWRWTEASDASFGDYHNGLLYLKSQEGVFAVDSDGKTVWKVDNSPTYLGASDEVIYTTKYTQISKYSASSGNRYWKTETRPPDTLTVSDGVAYLATADNKIAAYEDSSPIWTYSTKASVETPPLVRGNNIYAVDGRGYMFNLEESR